ncbi:nucleoside-diphosphate-sugar epimerase [Pedobacter sp. UYEF25]
MKIILTGASGYVGSNLIAFFSGRPEINILPLSLRVPLSEDALQGADCVIHLAGKQEDEISNPDSYYTVNYELTRKLYNAFLKSDAKRFIFMSSVRAASDSVTGVMTEVKYPNPSSDYGKSKLMAEEYIQSSVLPAGKSYYILRPCMIHGPGNKGDLVLLDSFVRKCLLYPLAALKSKRSYLSMGNLCFMMDKFITTSAVSTIFILADDEALSTSEMASILAESMDIKPIMLPIPIALVNARAKFGDRFGFPFNTQTLTKLAKSYVVSNAKIKFTLDIELPLTAREGLEITARFSDDKWHF